MEKRNVVKIIKEIINAFIVFVITFLTILLFERVSAWNLIKNGKEQYENYSNLEVMYRNYEKELERMIKNKDYKSSYKVLYEYFPEDNHCRLTVGDLESQFVTAFIMNYETDEQSYVLDRDVDSKEESLKKYHNLLARKFEDILELSILVLGIYCIVRIGFIMVIKK